MERSRMRGAMVGCLLGDAFGRPLEGISHHDRRLPRLVERRRSGRDPLGCSDDAEMMILVAESLVDAARLDPPHLLRWMAANYDPARGYGRGTRLALASGVPSPSIGNGAAVRVVPIAWLADHDVRAAARVTHGSAVAVDAAVVFAHAVANALGGRHFFAASLGANEPALADRLTLVDRLVASAASTDEAVRALGNGVPAMESVPLAIFCFLRWGPSFEEVVVHSALAGGDVDSIAAMSGSLAGASVGEAGLPPQWIARLERGSRGADHVRALADAICALGME
jgi:poly(ADP-ribose) glycohydrolase ARH3